MRRYFSGASQTAIAAVFWETLSLGSAITALLKVGFEDRDLYAVGVLTGSPPDLTYVLESTGICSDDFAYYNDCFQEGALLVVVHTTTPRDQRKAIDVVLRHGGTLPPSGELHIAADS